MFKEEINRIYSLTDTVIYTDIVIHTDIVIQDYTIIKTEENSRTYKNSESPLKMIGSPVCHKIPAGEKQGLEE
ncbi:hypothetical protein [Methanosarcina sp. 1.H.A.2.2]|uniref:hypothetical protein n=1 Tax=Methanosarcina sp. 1.H.A.2.2 TaxID=1483601 RepID=UPI000620F24A|nr:hypothetical protein [Methanosarcina sp. 1.H.A.2.2]KKH46888.1 hypothetical protein EO93_12715 [Methanosarcina sp. 1.H.A.2.2]